MDLESPDYAHFAVLYGPNGVGKTTELVSAFPPPWAIYCGPPGSFQVAETQLGVEIPAHLRLAHGFGHEINSLMDLTRWLGANAADLRDLGIVALVVDEYSILAASTHQEMMSNTKRYPQVDGNFVSNGAQTFWTDFKLRQVEFRTRLRELGLHVGLSCWARGPETLQNRLTSALEFRRGAPEVPSQKQVGDIVGIADSVWYASRQIGGKNKPVHDWLGQFTANPDDKQYISKTRIVRSGTYPGNLRAIMEGSRLAYELPRTPGLEWQSEVCTLVCDKVLAGGNPAQIWSSVGNELLDGGLSYPHVYTAMRDGIDRATVMQAQNLRF